MANPRTTSDFWDDTDEAPHYLDDEAPHYPKLTARRVAVAHALGVVGVLGTLALAAAAFAPRLSGGVHSLESLFAKEEARLVQPRAIAQVQAPPTATSRATPAPSVSPPSEPPAVEPPAAFTPGAPSPTTATASADGASSPSTTSQTPSTTATAPSESPAPLAVAPTPSQALVTPPVPQPTSNDRAGATPSSPAAAASPSVAAAPAPPTTSAASQVRRHARSEPRLTWGEIQRRRERYARWLEAQHLEEVH